MENELARGLSAGGEHIQYDAQVKKVLSQKVILAWILRRTVEGFGKMTIDEVVHCIEGTPQVACIPVNPGETNKEQISGMTNEDTVQGEGTIYFDIRFFAYRPDRNEKVKIIVNVEAQKNFWPGYRIETRGIFYAARMISAQLGPEFSTSNYDDIKKVVSIWICMNAGVKTGNAISGYCIQKRDLISGIADVPDAYDKMSVILIALNSKSESEDALLQMLNTLLATDLNVQEKKHILEDKFKIGMQGQTGKEVEIMCNLSEYVEEKGFEKGIPHGMEKEKRNRIIRMLGMKKYSYDEIADLFEVSVSEVIQIEKEALVSA